MPKSKAVKKAKAAVSSLTMPQGFTPESNGSSPTTPKTPKTPADEGIEFFESATKGEPIRVYELRLDPDGGPNKDRAVECFHLPSRVILSYTVAMPMGFRRDGARLTRLTDLAA